MKPGLDVCVCAYRNLSKNCHDEIIEAEKRADLNAMELLSELKGIIG